mmetsp:Transcript_30315/g.37357  ORF Transcript_30315/g.37357 Transcript_30315/m.37357 type:complete len:95 (+) Transcript_30315:731-1015(+)
MKQHAFFKGLNWHHLAQKRIQPPVYLSMDDDEVEKEQACPVDDDEAAFLNFGSENEQNEQSSPEGKDGDLFEDDDYEEENKTLNRVKQFTFIQD